MREARDWEVNAHLLTIAGCLIPRVAHRAFTHPLTLALDLSLSLCLSRGPRLASW